jgi:hypothetical protein
MLDLAINWLTPGHAAQRLARQGMARLDVAWQCAGEAQD